MKKNKFAIRVQVLGLALVLTLLSGFLFTAPALAAPTIHSKYYCLVDGDTCQPIVSKNADHPRPIASTTKIMTAILAVEYAAMDEIATVSPYADHTAEYTIGLRAGQQLPLGELMKATLIKSSNDAAVVLAEHIAGDEALFAHMMSLKAFAIGAMHTHFVNASGLPADDAFSTAYDLAVMGRYALSKPLVARLVAMPQAEFKHPAYREPLTIRNTNGLITSYSGITGIKTGTANESGKCLVASATRQKRNLIAVVLKSGDRTGDCARLLNYGFNQSRSIKVIDSHEVFKNAKINKAVQPYVEIVPSADLWLWVGESPPDIQKRVRMNYLLEAPLPRAYKVGEMDIYTEGQYVETIELRTRENVSRETFWGQKILQDLWQKLKNQE
ncbi:MAG TPA: D-alanyl-D-alanine carboxypeptidase family protein [Syntrophomonas sp.]|nr:D-alanyl-D-alanine carboxypeptidase family protein [Syntrophomonas sp.]